MIKQPKTEANNFIADSHALEILERLVWQVAEDNDLEVDLEERNGISPQSLNNAAKEMHNHYAVHSCGCIYQV